MKLTASLSRARLSRLASVLAAAVLLQQAALAGPLDSFALNHGGTGVQQGIAGAIQTVCPQLVATFGGIANALAAPESAQKDITLRCNELISTATDLDNPNVRPARSLNYSTPEELLAALQQVTGEENASEGTLAVRAANSQFSNIAARLGALRMAATGAGSTAPATAFNLDLGSAPALGGGASADDESPDGGANLSRGGFFLNGNLNTGNRDATSLEDGFDFNALSLTAGFDHRFDKGVLGVSIGYDSFDSDFKTSSLVSGGHVKADGASVSMFGMKDLGNFFIDGVVSFGSLSFDVQRLLRYDTANFDPDCQCTTQDRRLTSDPDATHYGVSFTAGGQVYTGKWLIEPSFVASFRRYNIDGYTENDSLANGGMALRFGDQTIDSLQSTLGVQFSRSIKPLVRRAAPLRQRGVVSRVRHRPDDSASQVRPRRRARGHECGVRFQREPQQLPLVLPDQQRAARGEFRGRRRRVVIRVPEFQAASHLLRRPFRLRRSAKSRIDDQLPSPVLKRGRQATEIDSTPG